MCTYEKLMGECAKRVPNIQFSRGLIEKEPERNISMDLTRQLLQEMNLGWATWRQDWNVDSAISWVNGSDPQGVISLIEA